MDLSECGLGPSPGPLIGRIFQAGAATSVKTLRESEKDHGTARPWSALERVRGQILLGLPGQRALQVLSEMDEKPLKIDEEGRETG